MSEYEIDPDGLFSDDDNDDNDDNDGTRAPFSPSRSRIPSPKRPRNSYYPSPVQNARLPPHQSQQKPPTLGALKLSLPKNIQGGGDVTAIAPPPTQNSSYHHNNLYSGSAGQYRPPHQQQRQHYPHQSYQPQQQPHHHYQQQHGSRHQQSQGQQYYRNHSQHPHQNQYRNPHHQRRHHNHHQNQYENNDQYSQQQHQHFQRPRHTHHQYRDTESHERRPSRPPPMPPPPESEGEKQTDAISILPQAARERLENEIKQGITGSDRKRPGRRLAQSSGTASSLLASKLSSSSSTSTGTTTTMLMKERQRNVLLQNVRRAQAARSKSTFTGLESLMKSTEQGEELERGLNQKKPSSSSLPTKATMNKKTEMKTNAKRNESENFYASIIMTKEMREREERERLEKEEKKLREKREIIEKYKRQRREERNHRQQLRQNWSDIETVAASMRHNYKLDRVERWLFHESEEDRHIKSNGLQRKGLKRKSLLGTQAHQHLDRQDEEMLHGMMTVDVIEI